MSVFTARRVLAPVDFSDMCRRALAEADDIAARCGAKLTVLHVHPVVQTAFLDATIYESPERLVPEIDRLEERLRTWTAELKTPVDRITTTVALGFPVDEIVAEAAKHDLVVIATHGRVGLSHFLMGSVAERVTRSVSCSVLVVKLPRDADA